MRPKFKLGQEVYTISSESIKGNPGAVLILHKVQTVAISGDRTTYRLSQGFGDYAESEIFHSLDEALLAIRNAAPKKTK